MYKQNYSTLHKSMFSEYAEYHFVFCIRFIAIVFKLITVLIFFKINN